MRTKRFTWETGDLELETPPPLREGDEMANPLDEAEDIENQLAEFERLMNESDESDESDVVVEDEAEELPPSVGDAGSVTQR